MSTRERPFHVTSGRSIRLGDLQRLGDAVERVSGVQGAGIIQGSTGVIHPDKQPPWFMAKLTAKDSSTPKKYSWTLVVPDGEGGWVVPGGAPSGTASTMPAYEANDITVDVTSPVYVQMWFLTTSCYFFAPDAEASAGGLLTVEEEDGAPSYATITVIEVNQADGLTLTQPGAGRVRISIADASVSQDGIVNQVAQEFAGEKTFNDTTYFEADWQAYFDANHYTYIESYAGRALFINADAGTSDELVLWLGANAQMFAVSGNSGNFFVAATPDGVMVGDNGAGPNLPSGGGPVVCIQGGANPTGVVAGTAGIFAKNVSGTVKLFGFDGAGAVTQLTP